MRTLITIVFIIAFSLTGSAQAKVNQTDAKGQKQGIWIAKYPDGTLRYEGLFVDGKPVGEWKRYHENGKIKAIMLHGANSERVEASLFDDEGVLYAKGMFAGTAKDSIWTYYNDKTIVGRENYTNGKRNGQSVTYFADGNIARDTHYSNDQVDGPWKEFFSSGAKKAELMFKDGQRNGWSIAYYENGQPQLEGKYTANQPDGEWTFFTEEGKEAFRLHYQQGKLLNPEVADSVQQKTFDAFDRMRGQLTEPTVPERFQ